MRGEVEEEDVTVHGARTSQVPCGGEMISPHLDQHLLHLSRSYIRHVDSSP
jgi:hypothetical protein